MDAPVWLLLALFGAASPLFVYALIASLFIPRILKEEVDARTALFKVAGAILIMAGVFLVS
ncbi:MAG: hypothetical protein PHF51_01140 [Candidatus ainarchaeum sp.]|nr:hypothetical protein [Candidatus ainarchaeum sp.]